jgi:hypothetical protein
MNPRTFGILAGIAVALGLLAMIGQNRNDDANIAGASAGDLLLPGLAADLESLVEITITGAGGARLVSLERSGTGWTVTEQGGYPAEVAAVTSLLIALAEARIVEEKTANPDFHARLGVEAVSAPDASGLEVVLVGDGGRHALVLGDAYTGGQRYARVKDRDLSVLIDRNPDIAEEPSGWVSPDIVDIASERVQRVEITHADGERLVLRKELRDDMDFIVDDIPEGRELQYTSIGNVSGTVLQNLELEEVAAAAEDPGEAVATVTFSTFDGLVVTVTMAAAGDEDPWLSFSAGFDAEQALAFASEPADDVTGGSDEPVTTSDAIAEAEALNERLTAWRYRIPAYQYSQLTRRIEDLLLAPPAIDE